MKIKSLIVSVLIMLLAGCSSNVGKGTEESSKVEQQPTVLYVTRHGKTMLNTLDRVQGWADTPLTEEGTAVASQLGKGLEKAGIQFKAVYSSDLGRAKETAKIVLNELSEGGHKVNELVGLREACYGMFEGDENANMMAAIVKENQFKSAEELTSLGLGMWKVSADTLNKIDEMKMAEDSETIVKRMNESLLKVAKETEKSGGGNVLVVGHGMSISMLLGELTDLPFEGHLANASVSKIQYQEGQLIVESIGDTSFIEAEEK